MRRLPPFATRDRAFGAVVVVALGIAQAACLAVAAFATRDAFAALHLGISLPLSTMATLALAGTLAALSLQMARRQAEALGQSYTISLRHALYEQIAKLPKSRHQQRRTGALSLRFVGDLSAARLWFGRGLPDVLTATVVLPCAIAILVALNPVLSLYALSGMGTALAIMVSTAWQLERRHRRLRKRRGDIAIAMIERIAIAPDLDLMGRTDKELQALDEQGKALQQDAVARRGRTAALQGILQVGVALSGLAMLWAASRNGTSPAIVAACLSVLALVVLPLQDLAAAWDRFCAWQVAREKALYLLKEPTLERGIPSKTKPGDITVQGIIADEEIILTLPKGTKTLLAGPHADRLARVIAGLDESSDLEVSFENSAARIAFIGDDHIGLQGTLRRSATLSARRRPKDSVLESVLSAFGLEELVAAPGGLDQRVAENGKGLTAAQTLRLDLARAVIGKADVLVISSQRWISEPEKDQLIETVQRHRALTVIVADRANHSNFCESSKAN